MSEPTSNAKIAPYFRIPLAVSAGLDNGSITLDQFDIFVYGYEHATRTLVGEYREHRVYSYSAANVAQSRGLDATEAVVKRYERAALDLWHRHLIGRDYYQLDPRRSKRAERTYSIWLPDPAVFFVIASPAENRLSLWRNSFVGLFVGHNVGLPAVVTDGAASSSQHEQIDKVGLFVELPQPIMSITNREDSQNREKEPLNPPSGDFSPRSAPPSRGKDAPAGVVQNLHRESKAAGKEPLDAKQCDALSNAVTLYIAVAVKLFGFSPNEDFVRNLLRVYMPTEVLFAHIRRMTMADRVGGTVPEDVPADKSHRISEVVAAYIADISKPDANNDCRSRKTIKEKQTILNSFVQFCGKTNIEELQGELGRKALTDYRDHLFTQEYEPDTVHKMMLAVVSWLKNNPVFPILKILKKQDWPDRKKTVPDPYTDAEIEGMLGFASPIEALIIRMFRGTGMREQELAHAELEDINWDAKYIQVHRRKPKFNWRSKNKAAKRQIPLGDSLLSDLKDHEPGLLFPHPKTGGAPQAAQT